MNDRPQYFLHSRYRSAIVTGTFLLTAAAGLLLSAPRNVPASFISRPRHDIGEPRGTGVPLNRTDIAAPPSKTRAAKQDPVGSDPGHDIPIRETTWNLEPYRGLGAWMDLYDFEGPGLLSAEQAVAGMQRRGIQTLFIQTGRWNLAEGVSKGATLGSFLDASHAKGIRVVGWYLPGFGDVGRDLARTVEAAHLLSPGGQRFDGFAVDIEDQREVQRNPATFAAGIIDYSKRLRDALPPGSAIGAIAVDAKNNERSPASWAGFPWGEIGQLYDVILPMAYWTVTKHGDCRSREFDSGAYLREVISKTTSFMGAVKPFHPIGGIADCITPGEVESFVNAGLQDKWIGMSVYDLRTTEQSPFADGIWTQLARARALDQVGGQG